MSNMVMIGRQNLHLKESQLIECFEFYDYKGYDLNKIMGNASIPFSDNLFSFLGADEIDSIDASNFEGASIVHDMNFPFENLKTKEYDLVLDSGNLEHVFNFPQAIKNCMQLVKKGAHFIGIYPCNNFFGHGFYQFSSELFYRTFSSERGFEILDIVLFVDEANPKFYSVPDTDSTHNRIQFTNGKPVYIYVLAKKTSKKEIFMNYPLQMDYSEIKWKGLSKTRTPSERKKKIKSKLPLYWKNLAKALLNKPNKDENNFQKVYFQKYDL